MVTYTDFALNISKARELIRLPGLKELMLQIDGILDALRPIRMLGQLRPAIILPSQEEIRLAIKGITDKIYEVVFHRYLRLPFLV